MPNRLLTRDEVYVEIDALFTRMGLKPPQHVASDGAQVGPRIEPPVVTDHVRAACDHCWHTRVQTQMCCWCGLPRTLQHGPYMPEGDR